MSRKSRPGRRALSANSPLPAPSSRSFTIVLGVLLSALLAVCIYWLTYRPISDPDTWFHLAAGRWILANHSFPHTDPFSYTAGNTPYVPSGWLAACFMAWLDGFSPDKSLGPILMVTAVAAITAFIVMLRAARVGALAATSLMLMAGMTAAVSRFSPRPDVFSMLGLTALVALLSTAWLPRRNGNSTPRSWPIWLSIPLVILWANLHAGVLIALPFLLTFAAWAQIQWKRTGAAQYLQMTIAAALACTAWLATPYGPGLLNLALRIASTPRVGWVQEWMPLLGSAYPMPRPALWMLAAMIGVIVLTMLQRGWRTFHPLELIWLALLTALMLWQRRQVGLFAFAVPLIMARHLVPAELRLRAWPWPVFAAPVALAILTLYLQFTGANGNGGGRPGYGRLVTALPGVAAEYIAVAKPPQPMFNPYGMGGYLIDRLYPDYKVFFDGRLDVYPHQVWLDFLAAEEGRLSIEEIANKYGLQTFVVRSDESYGDSLAMATRLASRADYALVHVDDYAAVFVHRTAETAIWLEENELRSLHPWDLKQMLSGASTPAGHKAALAELTRLRENFGESATVLALAAVVTAATGDEQAASAILTEARRIAPRHRLVQQAAAMAVRRWK